MLYQNYDSQSNTFEVNGKILSVNANCLCKVELENGLVINAMPSGKLRNFHIRLLPNDDVIVELSVYDITNGRIKYRK